MKSYWLRKLVRDNASARMESDGAKVSSRILAESEFIFSLEDKLKEELDELSSAKTVDEKTEEIADILELIGSYVAALGVSTDVVQKIQNEKRMTRGGFERREFVDYIETPEGSYYDLYCAATPHKYPIKND